jgi:hypothetical protein
LEQVQVNLAASGVAAVAQEGMEVEVWEYPNDPLPGAVNSGSGNGHEEF